MNMGNCSVNSATFCAGVISLPNTFIHCPKIYMAGSSKRIAKTAVIFLGVLCVDVMPVFYALNVTNFPIVTGKK